MQVTVRFAGPIRTLAGRQQESVVLADGATLRDLLAQLAATLPADFRLEIVEPLLTGAAPLALLLINAASLQGPLELERPLGNGDVIAFVPPMSGG